jgi:TrmH family RNA methyltransferase
MIAHMTVQPPPSTNPNLVDSLLHPEALIIRQLLTRPGRIELNKILIDDEENILQALEAGLDVESVYYAGDEILSDALKKKLSLRARVFEVARRTTKKLFENDKITRIFAIARTPHPIGLDAITKIEKDVVVLEDVSISGNIGAITRTSLALGVGGLVLLNTEHVDIYDRRLIRASRGYVFALPVIASTTEAFIRFAKQNNLQVLVTNAHAEKLVHEISAIPQRLMIVFGSEKEGCSQAITEAATLQVRIPIDPRVESLNVSAAAGITLYSRIGFNSKSKGKLGSRALKRGQAAHC